MDERIYIVAVHSNNRPEWLSEYFVNIDPSDSRVALKTRY